MMFDKKSTWIIIWTIFIYLMAINVMWVVNNGLGTDRVFQDNRWKEFFLMQEIKEDSEEPVVVNDTTSVFDTCVVDGVDTVDTVHIVQLKPTPIAIVDTVKEKPIVVIDTIEVIPVPIDTIPAIVDTQEVETEDTSYFKRPPVTIGMTTKQVFKVRGYPVTRKKAVKGFLVHEAFIYSDDTKLYFHKDTLRLISMPLPADFNFME